MLMPNECPESCRVDIWEWKYDPLCVVSGSGSGPLPSTSRPSPSQGHTLVKLNVSAHVENRNLLVHPIFCSEY
jgi:hypothetical protein